MSSDRPTGTRRGDLLVTLAVLGALLAALLPVLPMVRPGPWLLGTVMLAGILLGAGFAARRRGLPAVAVSLIEAVLWVVFLTFVFFRDSALLWVVPSFETFREVPALFQTALDEITVGAAPLEATPALSFLIVAALGILTIVVDHVVLTARMPLLASVGILAVSLIPAIAVPRGIDVMAFLLLAAALLFLLRAETRSREDAPARAAERSAGVPATAVGIAAIALVVTLVATPALPQPFARTGTGPGGGPGIDASLQLGDDLRRPEPVEVLRVRSSQTDAPYLRATTLSRFDGAVWLPDRVRTVPLDSEFGLGALGIAEDIRMVDTTTNVDVVDLASVWAPIPYPAVEVSGLDGRWAAVPYNRTVVSQSGSTQGQSYEVVASVPRPTLEQIRATQADAADIFDDAKSLPAEVPSIVAELAAEVTAETTNDYDALIAMQRWFRGGEFRYSLDAPVEDGFDGTGAEAVAEFLEVREGYCIHFASAFALMARTLGMPTRIVVGYLPGVATQERIGDQLVYSVSSSLLHAWPEVYFQSVGWIGFEPTAGLGTPTAFAPAAVTPNPVTESDDAAPQPSASASPSPSASTNLLDPRDDAAAGGTVTTANPLPAVGVVLAILLLLSLPGLLRVIRRRQLLAASRAGDSAAAWTTVQDAAIDVGIAVPGAESPRAFAERLVLEHGVPPDAMDTLVAAIERASYAPPRVAEFWHGDDVTDAAIAVRASLRDSAPPARRILAVLAPRSLVVRPGSVYAAGARARVG
ncbi:DUF3488 and transglutaminase-like domain-containing protein [Microbacterium sp. SLBN-146]|uniref:transglutaminase family protein n=1 Tax=Microbacterium sp. SLBN-146 TaxID=2768457 RepID=UPI001172F6ED|nr:DUF3488 and transglutaminase-like domain-containing protein [Microbacterium sp. SLBN-146]TQJ31340.1 transglutaminase superfamily protein [Microbacterium sp. SLBN-146]